MAGLRAVHLGRRDQPRVPSISTVPRSANADRHRREVQYLLAMSFRLVCLVLAFLVPGWWKIPLLAGATVLPWIAVMLANNADRRTPIRIDPGQKSLNMPKDDARHTGSVLRIDGDLENTG